MYLSAKAPAQLTLVQSPKPPTKKPKTYDTNDQHNKNQKLNP